MSERPILFSGSMVRAILEGRKSQTRRVVKAPKEALLHGRNPHWDDALVDGHPTMPSGFSDGGEYLHVPYGGGDMEGCGRCASRVFCPYGQPGDLLWVRETWGACERRDGRLTISYAATPRTTFATLENCIVVDRPDGFEIKSPEVGPYRDKDGAWRPSIFMPRWASRLTLRITDVRVERVRSISRADAIAEGIQNIGGDTERWGVPGEGYAQHPCRAYWLLWDSINGKKPGCTWADNPWVWVVEFEREEAPHA